jgi:hypothetical protein
MRLLSVAPVCADAFAKNCKAAREERLFQNGRGEMI